MSQHFVAASLMSEPQSHLRFEWMEPRLMRRVLCQAISSQAQSFAAFTEMTMDELLFELWTADRLIASHPSVGIATLKDEPVGVICADPWAYQSCAYIHALFLPKAELRSSIPLFSVTSCLIEAAIDFSIDSGYYGKVACHPQKGSESFWRQSKFSRHPDNTFRRMGYFT